LSTDRYKVQLTVSHETYEKLRRVQDLERHRFPKGDLAAIFDKTITMLLEDLENTRCGSVTRPRASGPANVRSRHVPAPVRRAVWTRDGGQCAFVGSGGRCPERGFLEIHHVTPFAEGGETVEHNLELRCRAHNAYEAEQHFGSLFAREAHASYDVGRDRAGVAPMLCQQGTRSGPSSEVALVSWTSMDEIARAGTFGARLPIAERLRTKRDDD